MTPENRQTEIDPEARPASAAPTVRPFRGVPEPTLPGPAIPLHGVAASTVPPVATSSPESGKGPEECEIGSLVVGRYLIEKKLGQGGMGAVYLGRDRRLLDKRVVVKVLLGEFARDEWVIRKFLQEKEALTRANHPGIVGILDAGELKGGKPFLVMEYIDGVTLGDAINPGGMTLKRAGELIRQIGSALSAAHDNGILHRDLKPENIMLQSLSGGVEQVRIIDFGIAKVHDSLVADNTVAGRFGTYTYMSPEQFRVEEITAASDVYSMGAIAYEMVTGHAPFDPRSYTHIGNMYSDGVKVLPREHRRELPERAQKLILNALSQRPQDRFQNAVEFGDSLAQALSEKRALRARPASWQGVGRLLRGQARFMRLGMPAVIVILTALIVVVAASLIAPVFWGGSKKPEVKPTFVPRDSTPPSSTSAPVPGPVARSSLTYWLAIKKMKTPDRRLIESSGDETFDNGDQFQINTSIPKPGYFYLVHEGSSGNLEMIHPTARTNRGAAKLKGAGVVEGRLFRFSGVPGTERIWIVWSSVMMSEMELAREEAVKNKGRLTEELQVRVRNLLESHADSESQPGEVNEARQTVFSSNADVLVKLLKLKHQ